MKKISMLEFRKNARKVIQWAQKGERVIMTYRGKPIIRMEPILDETPDEDDPFYVLYEKATDSGKSMTNDDMDEVIYGS
jgi:antitoxin (DNA-binding transcriptional repressor) of toxin-antitoxin stability system